MSHYFQTPTGEVVPRPVRMRFWDADWEFATAPGVFSGGGLDPGTAVLLRESPPPVGAQRLLDLGCGYGVLAVALAKACPTAQVDAVDVNEHALRLCDANAAAHQVASRVHALTPDQADPTARYDEIWSNPPIRIGKEALHSLLLNWLPRLARGGTARLVVGKHLGADSLQAWLVSQGYECRRVASAKGFRVFAVTAED